MARRIASSPSLTVAPDQPLIGLILEEDGRQVERYFADEDAADGEVDGGTARALAAIGSWHDPDWDETAEALDRIRQESTLTP